VIKSWVWDYYGYAVNDKGYITGKSPTLGIYEGPTGFGGNFSRAKKLAKQVKALPALDQTGKVHGTLPKVKDLAKYSKEDLKILLNELKQSVHQRIKVTSKLGRDRTHGQRQGAEQDLIYSLKKYLNDL
jgi:hypothetical protein